MHYFNPIKLIEEVKNRPQLYKNDQPVDREEKLLLWKDIGAAICSDWADLSKAVAYDRVLYIQKKWRSLRDAYNRELRARRTGLRTNRRVYMYFRRMSFLGGFEGTISDTERDDEDVLFQCDDTLSGSVDHEPKPKIKPKKRRSKKRKIKKSSTDSESIPPVEMETEMNMFPVEIGGEEECDSDRLFLLSFLPEMRQLPVNIKMWARAQIAKVMQDAVDCHYSNTLPESSNKNCPRRPEMLDDEEPLNC